MPIRFRCAYCNQLMGIARRKAGTVVSCPTCQGQVVVPSPSPSPEPELVKPMPVPLPASPQEAPAGNVFDQHDFDPELFNPDPVPIPGPSPGPAFSHPLAGPAPAPLKPLVSVGSEPFALPEPSSRAPRGMVLTAGKLALLLIGASVAGLILFGLGVLVGRAF